MIGLRCVSRWALKAYGSGPGLLLSMLLFVSALPCEVAAQEAALTFLPLRPFNFDVSFNHRTFAPTRRLLRTMMPIYYSEDCLTCHGSPKGILDMSGYPREGAQTGELAGAISVQIPMDPQ